MEFLARQRHPFLIAKLRHLPLGDWQNDFEDVRNLVASLSRDGRIPFRWRVVDWNSTDLVRELSEVPIVFLNGHEAPELSLAVRQSLRQYVERGGCILADACCDSPRFDEGFRRVVKEIFPESAHALRPVDDAHPIWRAKHELTPEPDRLWTLEHGSRVALVYSRRDLSCFWDEADRQAADGQVNRAMKLGQNIVTFLTSQGPGDFSR